MFLTKRVVVAISLVAAAVLAAASADLSACSTIPPELSYEQASTVFVGHIIRTEEAEALRESADSPPIPVVEASLRVMEVLKGKPPMDGKVKTAVATISCNAPLIRGFDYVIFLHSEDSLRPPNLGAYLLSSLDRDPAFGTDTRRVLEKLRSLSRSNEVAP